MDDKKPLIFNATGGSAIFERMVATGLYEFLHCKAGGPIPKSRRIVNADGTFTYPGLMIRTRYPDGETALFLQPWINADAIDKHPCELTRKDVANLAADAYRGTLYGRQVVVVGDFSTHSAIILTHDVCNAVLDEEAMKLTLVVPKSTLPKDKARRQAILQMFAAIPHTPQRNRLVLVDDDFAGSPEYTRVKVMKRERPFTGETAYELFGDTSKPILIPTSSYRYLAERMMKHGDFEMGEYETELVEGKPFFKRLKTKVRGRRVIIVSGTIDDRETMELYYLARAVAEEGALSRQIMMGYARRVTQERKTKSGEAVNGKTDARMLSSLPGCQMRNRVVFADLHAEGFPHYLEGGMQHQHVYMGKHLVAAMLRQELNLSDDVDLGKLDVRVSDARLKHGVLASTDIGRYKWVDSMGDDIGIATAFGNKKRDLKTNETVFLGAMGDVHYKVVIVYDDKCGTGGTAMKATLGIRIDQYGGQEAIDELKKKHVSATFPSGDLQTSMGVFSHFVGDKTVVRKMLAAKDELGSPVFAKIFAVDSHPLAYAHANDPEFKDRFFVFSAALLFAKAVAD